MEWLSPIREVFELLLPFLDRFPFIRAIIGFVLVFFLPGFAWTLVFFNRQQINLIERLALSFGLSIAVVTLSILAINIIIGVRITGFNAVLVIGTVTIVPIIWYFLKRSMGRQGDNSV